MLRTPLKMIMKSKQIILSLIGLILLVAGSAFAVPSQYEPPPSTSSSAAAANSRGRINEFTGSPGWPPDELEARLAGEGGVASRPAALDRARGFPAGGVPVIRQTRTSEPPGANGFPRPR